MKVLSLNNILTWLGIIVFMMLTSCSSKQPVNFNVHTEPEGAHVVYSLDDQQWIYLGVTPLDAIEVVDESRLKGTNTLTLKAMRCGYLDQSKEWTGNKVLEENKEKGMIFWTPRLIKDVK